MRIAFGGSQMNVRISGAGVPVLWIHGFPLSSELFTNQMSIEGARHVVPDLPGFGESDPFSAEPTIDLFAEAVVAVADALDLHQAIFAGVSMGGYIAMSIARHFPERVAGLALIDTRETADTEEGKKTRFEQASRIRAEGLTFLVEAMLPKMLSPAAMANDRELVDFTRSMMLTTSSSGAISALHAMAGRIDSAETLARLNVPSLVAVGSDDPITPRGDAERMSALLRDCELLIIDGGAHLALLEKPAEFNEGFTRLLERVAEQMNA